MVRQLLGNSEKYCAFRIVYNALLVIHHHNERLLGPVERSFRIRIVLNELIFPMTATHYGEQR